MRAAIYARYSTGNQSPLSIDRQLELCRALAAQLGASVAREFTDAEISGFVSGARPGVSDLLAFARAGSCDLVIAEHSDRLARDGGMGWDVFNLFRALGIRYVTVQEGEVTIVHQGVSGLMSELKGEEARVRTRGGLRQVVEDGRNGGGLTYGYRVKRQYDAKGEPIRGLLEVDDAQAEVVRRIYRAYAAGESPRSIVSALNAEGVVGPRGGLWNASALNGNPQRQTGILHNELYAGVRIWGRRTFVKDRATGRRRGRAADAGQVLRQQVPELAIVTPDLWAAVRARYAQVQAQQPTEGRKVAERRPVSLLSGLMRCGCCGGPMTLTGPDRRWLCTIRREKGPAVCDNGRSAKLTDVEDRVLAAIRDELLHPEAIETAMKAYHEHMAELRKAGQAQRFTYERDLAEVRRRLERIVDQVEAGTPWAVIAGRHAELEARRAELEASLLAADGDAGDGKVVTLDPRAPARWRALVERLQAALQDRDTTQDEEAREALRQVVKAVRVFPLPERGRYRLEVGTDLAPVLQTPKSPSADGAGALRFRMGAGTRCRPEPNEISLWLAA